jgi:hypothetical protein
LRSLALSRFSGSRFSPTPEKMRGRRKTGGDFSTQYDELRLEPAAAHVDQEHRAGRRAPSLGRAAGIEDPDVAYAFGLRDVGVSVDDGFGARKTSRQARLAPGPRARRVQHPDPPLLDLDDAAFGQKSAQLRLVGVAVNGRQRRPEPPQLLERRDARDVAGVEDQIRGAQELDAAIGKSARATRQVRIGDNGDARQPTPFKKRPSR